MKHRKWLRGRGKYALLLSAAVMLPAQAASVRWEEAGDEGDSVDGDLWEATREDTGKAWEATKEASGHAWAVTKEGSARAWDKTREVSGEVWDKTREFSSEAWGKTRDFTIETWDKSTGNAEPGAPVDTGHGGSRATNDKPGP
jgi:hypothetical protein